MLQYDTDASTMGRQCGPGVRSAKGREEGGGGEREEEGCKSENEIEIEIAPNVRVTVLRDTISTVLKPVAANDAKAPAKAS